MKPQKKGSQRVASSPKARATVRPRADKSHALRQSKPRRAKPAATRSDAPAKPAPPIPAILFEGDEVPPPVLRGPGQRFVLAPTPAPAERPGDETGHELSQQSPGVKPAPGAAEDLPSHYGTGRLIVAPRDPHWLFAHWDFSDQQIQSHQSLAAAGALTLRLHREGPTQSSAVQVLLPVGARSSFVPVSEGGREWRVELGYLNRAGRWQRVAVSEAVSTPPEMKSVPEPVLPPPVQSLPKIETTSLVPPPPGPSPVPRGTAEKPPPAANPEPVGETTAAFTTGDTGRQLETAQPERSVAPQTVEPKPAPLPAAEPATAPAGRPPVGPIPREPSYPAAPQTFAAFPVELPLAQLAAQGRWVAPFADSLVEALAALRAAGRTELPLPEEIRMPPWTPAQALAMARLVHWELVPRNDRSSLAARVAHGEVPTVGRALQAEVSGGALAPMPAGFVSSAAVPMPPGPPRGFWLNVNAELVVYGATEPDARVRVAGRRIGLRPDGSFTLRFALPDGEYDLAVEAMSAAGDEGRRAVLHFRRATEYEGVGRQPPATALPVPPVAANSP